jgi:hypothetical protein
MHPVAATGAQVVAPNGLLAYGAGLAACIAEPDRLDFETKAGLLPLRSMSEGWDQTPAVRTANDCGL